MWNGKMKALTFSFDDGTQEDIRLVKLFNKYGMKATFNLNSGLLCPSHKRVDIVNGKEHVVRRLEAKGIEEIYKGHEIACHTLQHPRKIIDLEENEIRNQIYLDRRYLEYLFNTKVYGLAYPGGWYDERCVKILEEEGFLYARTINNTFGFDMPEKPLELPGTCHFLEGSVIPGLVEKFIKMEPEKPQMFYIWGHAYELRNEEGWQWFEDVLKSLSGRDDIFYGTNYEVLSQYYNEK